MKHNRANYVIVESESTPTRLVIRDVGPWDQFWTVTNAADEVVRELFAAGKLSDGRSLFYYDSAGELDRIVHDDGRFIAFAPGRHGEP